MRSWSCFHDLLTMSVLRSDYEFETSDVDFASSISCDLLRYVSDEFSPMRDLVLSHERLKRGLGVGEDLVISGYEGFADCLIVIFDRIMECYLPSITFFLPAGETVVL